MNKYEVSKINLTKDENSNTKAYANVVVNDTFSINGVRLMENQNGSLFIGTPSYQDSEGKFHEQMHPITKEDREAFNNAIIDTYKARIEQIKENSQKKSQIENVRIYLNDREDIPNVMGSASFNIGGFAVKGVGIMRNQATGEIFLSYPSYKREDGTYKSSCNPITKAMNEEVNKVVFEEFDKAVAKREELRKGEKKKEVQKKPNLEPER